MVKAARHAAAGGAALLASATGALAQCTTTGFAGFPNVAAFVPIAQGSAVNSIISTVNTVNTGSLAQSTAFISSPANPKPDQQGGGSWARIIAGSVETEANSLATANVTNFLTGANFAGTVSCQSVTKQDFVGTQVGMDLAKHNFAGGGNIHVGLTAGWFDVHTRDKTPGQGTFEADSQLPFAGIYAAIYSGPITIDAQVRWDFIENEYTDIAQGLFGQRAHARSTAFLWNAAYRFDLPQSWYIEPSLGAVYSSTEIEDLNIAGTYAAGNPQGSSPGILKIDDVSSLTGRASLRVGKNFVTGKLAWTSFVTASVFHEFAGNVQASVVADDRGVAGNPGGVVPAFSSTAAISTSRVGTYGHIGWGIAGTILDTGWLGYARLDYRKGDDLDSFTVNAGLRYQFAPPKDHPGGSVKDGGDHHHYGYRWTGLYAGWFSGVTWNENDVRFVNGERTNPDFSGYLAGGRLGYLHQLGHVVLGIEGDIALTTAEGGQACSGTLVTAAPAPNPNQFLSTCNADLNWLSFVTGRFGLVRDRAMIYAKGGLAIGEVEAGHRGNVGSVPPGPAATNEPVDSFVTKTLTGWTLGAGIEFALSDRWTASAEYMYYDLGKERFETAIPFNGEITGNTVRVGASYRFGGSGYDYGHDAMK